MEIECCRKLRALTPSIYLFFSKSRRPTLRTNRPGFFGRLLVVDDNTPELMIFSGVFHMSQRIEENAILAEGNKQGVLRKWEMSKWQIGDLKIHQTIYAFISSWLRRTSFV